MVHGPYITQSFMTRIQTIGGVCIHEKVVVQIPSTAKTSCNKFKHISAVVEDILDEMVCSKIELLEIPVK